MTSKELEKKASRLSKEPYSIGYGIDETVDGQKVYLLNHPELQGCMAQGITIEEALKELQEVRYEYLLSLLEDGLPIPRPMRTTTETMGGISESLSSEQAEQDIMEELSRAIEPTGRHQMVTVSVVC